ncbi:protein anachronism isoform X3 [Bradysia coprophila]|uniref:protein anachronism isoform X3 n=1 Tax=Bradysia coprophila TaxID=38358 RepID=UPI00187D89B5|nr:protein anachronism isoform X3 [Bradysia coprophila]
MLCPKPCHILILLLIKSTIIFGAPQTADDDDRVISHVIDPTSNETELFTFDSNSHDDRVVSTVVDMNSSDSSKLFNQFNISMEEVMRRINKQDQTNSHRNVDEMEAQVNDNSDGNKDSAERGQFIEIFKQKIMSSVDRQNNGTHDLADDQSSNTIHNVAFYPVCSMNNETSWLADNTAKLYFSTHLLAKLEPNTYLHNAKLRLKQKDPDHSERTTPTRCDEPVEIIRVTVSVFVKRSIKGEMKSKKRVCTSFTTPKNNNGWIEIDVRQVIRHWEKAYRANTSSRGGQTINDPVLTIDVEDQDQNPLKAGLYFEPTDCQQQQQSHGVSIGTMTFGIVMDIARCPTIHD